MKVKVSSPTPRTMFQSSFGGMNTGTDREAEEQGREEDGEGEEEGAGFHGFVGADKLSSSPTLLPSGEGSHLSNGKG